MNENKTTQSGDCAADTPKESCSLCLSPKQALAVKLRELSRHANGEDKCTLCKAAEELDKPEKGFGLDWGFVILFALLYGGFGDGIDIDPDGVKAYMDAVDKKRDKIPESIKP